MKRCMIYLAILVSAACGSSDPTDTDDTDDPGACGAVSTEIMAVRGIVETDGGIGIEGVTVILEDRGWNPGTTLGTVTTDEEGMFFLENLTITDVENCWGSMLDYVLVASLDAQTAEKEINTQLYNAIIDSSLEADVSAFPLVLSDSD